MTENNLGFVSPYLERPLRTKEQAEMDIADAYVKARASHPVPCPRCGEPIAADCEPDGCRDPECPRAK